MYFQEKSNFFANFLIQISASRVMSLYSFQTQLLILNPISHQYLHCFAYRMKQIDLNSFYSVQRISFLINYLMSLSSSNLPNIDSFLSRFSKFFNYLPYSEIQPSIISKSYFRLKPELLTRPFISQFLDFALFHLSNSLVSPSTIFIKDFLSIITFLIQRTSDFFDRQFDILVKLTILCSRTRRSGSW